MASSSGEIQQSNSTSKIATFESIITTNQISQLLKSISDAQDSLRAATQAQHDGADDVVDGKISGSTHSYDDEEESAYGGSSSGKHLDGKHLDGKLEKLRIDLNFIQESFNHLRKFEENVVNPFDNISRCVNDVVERIKRPPLDSLLQSNNFKVKLRELDKMVNDVVERIKRPPLDFLLQSNNFKVKLRELDKMVNDVVERIKRPPLDSLLQSNNFKVKLRELDKMVTDLKLHIPSSHKMYTSANSQAHHSNASAAFRIGDGENEVLHRLPILYTNELFLRSSAYIDIKGAYDSLGDFKYKLGLLCFSIFPVNAIVKRRVLLYWWIGEGFILAEDAADEILIELVKKGLLEPVDQKHRSVANSFRMHSLTRSVVIKHANDVGFFDFDEKGDPTANFGSSRRACLIGVGSSFNLTRTINANNQERSISAHSNQERSNSAHLNQENSISAHSNQEKSTTAQLNQEKLCTLYNVNEQYLKFEAEWFLKLKNARVLQLGRWMSSAEHHIEVEDVEFLKNMKNMKHLVYFSLQGISRISELPDTVGSLISLRILDLRACHNLEILPKGISLLKNLTHLDLSECYLLDNVPKEISSLRNLQVLKGFVIGDARGGNPCTLDDLKVLSHLRKLSICTGSKDFPSETEVKALEHFEALSSLKITWGGNSLEKAMEADNRSSVETTKGDHAAVQEKPVLNKSKTISRFLTKKESTFEPQALKHLQKLDLECFPNTKKPFWLDPSCLPILKKLYVRGGRLSDLCEVNYPWKTVEILCLKYQYELTMDWTEVQESFPDLKYLEFVKCPKITFVPCNDEGVWSK